MLVATAIGSGQSDSPTSRSSWREERARIVYTLQSGSPRVVSTASF
jgi:hypothetical protein